MKRLLALGVAVGAAALSLQAPAASAATTTTCDGTLTGTYDAVLVPAGATCVLDGATVTGHVRVQSGGTLKATGSTLGSLHSEGARTVRLTDTDVSGNIKVSGTVRATVIGGQGCQVDPVVAGNVIVTNNLGNVAVCDLTVAHNLLVIGNDGRVGLYRNTVGDNIELADNSGLANRVRDNTVSVNLNCHDNSGKVLSSGNTAKMIMGQCTA